MAKNPDYGTTTATPRMEAYFSSVQKPDKYMSRGEKGRAGTDTYSLNLVVDLDSEEHKALLAQLTAFENERRASYGQPTTEMTTALKSKRDKTSGETHKLLKCKTIKAPIVLDQDGQQTGLDVFKGDTVIGAITPKFNDDAFGQPLLALYFDAVRILEKGSGGGGGSNSVALLGGDISNITVEDAELPELPEEDEGAPFGANKGEDLLSGVDVEV